VSLSRDVTDEDVRRVLDGVLDPELGLSVVALGLVYGIDVTAGGVRVTMTLTTPGCPIHDVMLASVRRAVMAVPGVENVEVILAFDPPWTPDRMAPAAPLAPRPI
jgi:metal-sulfur cluster biosynthetic enzyme